MDKTIRAMMVVHVMNGSVTNCRIEPRGIQTMFFIGCFVICVINLFGLVCLV